MFKALSRQNAARFQRPPAAHVRAPVLSVLHKLKLSQMSCGVNGNFNPLHALINTITQPPCLLFFFKNQVTLCTFSHPLCWINILICRVRASQMATSIFLDCLNVLPAHIAHQFFVLVFSWFTSHFVWLVSVLCLIKSFTTYIEIYRVKSLSTVDYAWIE